MPVSEKQRKSQEKYDKENMAVLTAKAKKEIIAKCKEYAEKNGMTASKFSLNAMLYCIENNITFKESR